MVLPASGSISVSQILTEYGIPAATASAISNNLFPLVNGVPGTTCTLPDSFYGKSSGAYIGAAIVNGTAADQGLGVACDSLNNVYITGLYGSSSGANISNFAVNPSGTAGTLPLIGTGPAAFVAKWNSAGTYIGAAIVIGTSPDQGLGVACDSLNNVYITGLYGSAAANISNFAVNPSGTAGTLPFGPGFTGGFVAKWNTSGTYIGAAIVDGTANDQALGVACDSLNNIYITGDNSAASTISSFALNPTLTTTPTGNLPPGGTCAFVAKWNTSGTYIGAAIVNGVSTNDQGFSVARDSLNNVYITGLYGSSSGANISNFAVNPSGTAGTLPLIGTGPAGFVAKWNTSGTYIGAAIVIGTSTDQGLGVARDSLNNVYITGFYGFAAANISNFAVNPSGTAGTLPALPVGGTGGFVAKWNSAGTYIGAAIVDGTVNERALGVARDSFDNVYITGFYGAAAANISNFAVNPSGTAGTLPATVGLTAAFVAKWNTSGIYRGAAIVDGTANDQGLGVACDSLNKVYITGFYGAAAANISNFAVNPSGTAGTLPATVGLTAAFVAKWTL